MNTRRPCWATFCLYAVAAVAAWFGVSWLCVRVSDGEDWEVWIGPGGARVIWGQPVGANHYFVKPLWFDRGIGVRTFCPVPWARHLQVLRQHDLWLPSWPVALPLIVWFAVMAERRSYRRRTGCCLHCGYNLTGNVTGRCPECGAPTRRGVQA